MTYCFIDENLLDDKSLGREGPQGYEGTRGSSNKVTVWHAYQSGTSRAAYGGVGELTFRGRNHPQGM